MPIVHWRQSAWNVKTCFLGEKKKKKEKKNISVACWNFFLRALNIKRQFYVYSSLRHLLRNGIIYCNMSWL